MVSPHSDDSERLLAAAVEASATSANAAVTTTTTSGTSTTTTTRRNSGAISSSGTWTLRRSLFVVLGALVMLVVWSIGAEYSVLTTAKSSFLSLIRTASDVDDDSSNNGLKFYPPEVFATDWSTKIPPAELLHVTALHAACVKHKDAIIPWDFGIESATERSSSSDASPPLPESVLVNEHDANLLETLRQCPDVDVFLPGGIRSFGYCEDAAVYTKFLQSRMLPLWVASVTFRDDARNRTFTYHDLCPHTPMLFFNHYWEDVPSSPSWPATKPIYLMPNIEMNELDGAKYAAADVILCKTAVCTRYLHKWFAQVGNPKHTKVLYTRHTTSDVALAVRTQLGDAGPTLKLAHKNFTDVRFTHTAGSSIQKGTSRILNCWITRPDLPRVDIYIDKGLYDAQFRDDFGPRIAAAQNIGVHIGKLDALAFGKLIAESAFFLCPSYQEGYGHYINQARASGAMILTTDVAPMNELITRDSGALLAAKTFSYKGQFLGGTSESPNALRGVAGYVAKFTGDDVCASVDAMLRDLTPADYEARAARAFQQFLFDTIFFAQKMQELREVARTKSHHLHLRRDDQVPRRDATTTTTTTTDALTVEKTTTTTTTEENDGADSAA